MSGIITILPKKVLSQ